MREQGSEAEFSSNFFSLQDMIVNEEIEGIRCVTIGSKLTEDLFESENRMKLEDECQSEPMPEQT